MADLVIAANRLPLSLVRRRSGLELQPSSGGLATGLGSIYHRLGARWWGWPGLTARSGEEEKIKDLFADHGCRPVFIPSRLFDGYYNGFCNKTIWPLFHCFTETADCSAEYFEAYREANLVFAQAILSEIDESCTIWIHDYHLMLLPALLRRELPRARIGFFLHIPFPSYEVFTALPWGREILAGLVGADLVGFHTYDYVLNFLQCLQRMLGSKLLPGGVSHQGRRTTVDSFPMGIDFRRFSQSGENPTVKREIDRIRRKVGDRKLILSIDRLDYTKGIPDRLEAFDVFLEKYPQYRERVILLLLAVPTRSRIEPYVSLKRQVEELVGKINGKYGTVGWTPIWYLYRYLSFERLSALYQAADFALVTPLRDGMNLIAKEYIAAKNGRPGVLILSEMAGAAKEMGEAIIVNPKDKEGVADALEEALSLPVSVQTRRNRAMAERLQRWDIEAWARDFIGRLVGEEQESRAPTTTTVTSDHVSAIVSAYRSATDRLLVLDYDGTLVPFAPTPVEARPDTGLHRLLASLASDPGNEVLILSGRDRETLEAWLGNLRISIGAEHGALVKKWARGWMALWGEGIRWKDKVRPVLDRYAAMTPGAFVEEKQFSLVWHYRKSPPNLAASRSNELKEILCRLFPGLPIETVEGEKVLEVRTTGISKARALRRWLIGRKWDFVLVAGDDETDEDMFAILPPSAFSIKVGPRVSRAALAVGSPAELREILCRLVQRALDKWTPARASTRSAPFLERGR